MGKPGLGIKCTCTECSERFYDLNRSPAVCPKCGAQQQPKARVTRLSRSSTAAGVQARRAPAAAIIDDEAEIEVPPDTDEDDAAETDEEADDDIEIDAAHVQTAD